MELSMIRHEQEKKSFDFFVDGRCLPPSLRRDPYRSEVERTEQPPVPVPVVEIAEFK
jgi:hypothetical protein